MGRIVCKCGYDGKAKKGYINPDGTNISSGSVKKDKYATAYYYCPRCYRKDGEST